MLWEVAVLSTTKGAGGVWGPPEIALLLEAAVAALQTFDAPAERLGKATSGARVMCCLGVPGRRSYGQDSAMCAAVGGGVHTRCTPGGIARAEHCQARCLGPKDAP